MTMTRELAHAAATDKGNAAMRAGGRTAWSKEDYKVASDEHERLWPLEKDFEAQGHSPEDAKKYADEIRAGR